MKTCATCNASHKNTVDRVLRCMGCVAKPDGNSNWRPLTPNVELRGRAAGEGPVERSGTNLSAGLGGADIGDSK